MTMHSVNPVTNEVVYSINTWDGGKTKTTLDHMEKAWQNWSRSSFSQRAKVLQSVAAGLRNKSETLAQLITAEMGKPLAEARLEVEKCAMICEHYIAIAPDILAPEHIPGSPKEATVTYEAQGIVLAVMPWNFPFWQVFRIAVPTLMAGNSVALKHAPSVPGCAQAIEEVFASAGLPPHVFRSFFIPVDQVATILSHPAVTGVCLTGSCEAGRSVASAAGQHLKKSVLELGGSDPFLVLPDADLDATIPVAVASRCRNAGQACIAAKRFLVYDAIYDAFLERLCDSMSTLRVGDPTVTTTDMGPLASLQQRKRLQDQVDRCVAAGGKIILGGTPISGEGAYYPPTIISDVPATASVAQEEIFGPVALIFRVHSDEEAIAVANGTDFGLGGSVWTADTTHGRKLAAAIRSGAIFVNALVRSDPFLPFGGTRASGYGRELGSYGLREFVNIKTIYSTP